MLPFLSPAVLGIAGTIGTFVLNAVGLAIAFAASRIGVIVAIRLAVVTVMVTLLIASLYALSQIGAALNAVMPQGWSVVQQWVIPPNLRTCCAIMLTAQITAWLWSWKQYVLDHLSNIS